MHLRLATIVGTLALVIGHGAAPAGDVGWAGRRPTILTLVVNRVPYGDALVLLAGGDALVVDSDLRRAGVAIGGAITQTVRERRFVSLRSLGIRFVADEVDQAIHLDVPADLLATTRLELGRAGAPPGTLYLEQTSVYVNYAVQAARDVDRQASSRVAVDGFGEVGVRARGALLHSTITASIDEAPVRGLSSLTLDDRDDVRRWIAGDRVASGGGLGGTAVLGGLHLVRAFALDPYLATTPPLVLRGAVTVPTTADIYVDGALVRQVTLPPGAYDLSDVPATTGAGATRIVLRDPLGNTQELDASFYLPAGLLRPGLSDYELSIGFQRDDLAHASFRYGGPAALGRYQRGLADRLTAGVRAEATPHLASGGLSLRTASRLGQLELAAGASVDRGAPGAAGSLAWSFAGRRGGGSLVVRALSRGYATLDADRDRDRALFEARLAGSRPLARRLSAGAQITATRHRDAGWSSSASVSGSLSTAGGFTLATTAGATADARDGRALFATASLSFRVGARTRGAVSHRQVGRAARDRVELRRAVPDGRGVGYRLTAEHGDRDQGSGELEAMTGAGRYHLAYQQRADVGRADASVAGGLALLGGHLFVTPPIDRSFVLVRVPGAPGVGVTLDNKPVGRTDRRGELLVTGALPYYGNRIAIEAADLPGDRPPLRTSLLLAPPDRGGVVVTFLAPRLEVVRGRVHVARGGRSIAPAYGELLVGAPASFADPDGEQWASPLGGDGEFEIAGLPSGSFPATIWWDGGHCELTIAVPAPTGPITTLALPACVEAAP